jgi:hypothetical protein
MYEVLPFSVIVATHPRRPPRLGFIGEVPTPSESDSSLGVAPIPHPRFPKSFPCRTSENSPVSPAIATDPKTPFSKPCVCHTSETPGGGIFRADRLFIRLCYPLSPCPAFPLSPFLSDSCALFCTCQNLNSFAFKRLLTLCQKPPGWGVSSPFWNLSGRSLRTSLGVPLPTLKTFQRSKRSNGSSRRVLLAD